MTRSLVLSCLALFIATPAAATPITWEAADQILQVSDPGNQFPGLTIGTPWSLRVTFDPSGPAQMTSGSSAGDGCNVYATGAATFQLGPYTYTRSSGQVFTNSLLPGNNCNASVPSSPDGMIQFFWGNGWTVEPGAWNLNQGINILVAGYYDANQTQGALPVVPVASSNQGPFGGLEFERLQGASFSSTFQPRLVVDQATPVPEPGTLLMMGAGLAYLARRRGRARSS